MIDNKKLALNFGKRASLFICIFLICFLCIFLICFLIASLINWMIIYKWGISATSLQIATVIQDVTIFILPALVISMLITRIPATFLGIDKKPRLSLILLTLVVIVLSIPVMNYIVEWNESITLPDSFGDIEKSADDSINIMLSGTSVGRLVVTVLIVGIFTGLSEELFFRGAIQNLLHTRPMNPHLAIWCTAFIFSAVHLQFYGFVPRLLLGAFFGYLVWWSGSLWLPVIAHAFNNSLVAIATWLTKNNLSAIDINNTEIDDPVLNMALITASVIATAFVIILIRRIAIKQ